MRNRPRWAVAGLIVAAIFSSPPSLSAAEPDAAPARQYLEALRTSNMSAVDAITGSRMARWTKKNFPAIYDYKIVRGELLCSQTFSAEAVQADLARYDALVLERDAMLSPPPGTPRPDVETVRKAFAAMEGVRTTVSQASTCLAEGMTRIPYSSVLSPDAAGKASVVLTEFVVDIEAPGRRASKETQRRVLTIIRVSTEAFDSGPRVIGFWMVAPR
jgi:hypothetical protein